MKRPLKRAIFSVIAALEIIAAAIILLIGYRLPTALGVEAVFGSAREMASISRQSAATLQKRIDTLQSGTQELARAMSDVATGLDAIASIQIPIVTLSGVTPSVRWQRIWPDDYNPAERFRKLAAASVAGEEVASDLAMLLPELQADITEMETTLEQYGSRTAQSLGYVRVLMWLVASLVGLHGCVLLVQEASEGAYALSYHGQL